MSDKKIRKMKKAVADMIADPEKFKRETLEAARREHPDMTEEQLKKSWELVEKTFGL